jgi:hypothetical protein
MKIITGKKKRPRNVLLYGEHGSGKTTLAATFPKPILLDIEGGADDLDVARSERIKDFGAFQVALSWLCTESPDYSTVIVDSVDWLEAIVQKHVAESQGKKSIEEIGYGKGYKFAAESFGQLLSGFRRLNDLGKATVLICHAKTVKHSPPDGDTYDRIEPDLHTLVQSLLVEFCDEVFFLTRKVFTRKEDMGFKRERSIAFADSERILITSDTASVVAKNRLAMPVEIPATFAAYAAHIGERNNIDGIVTNGSSKKERSNV